MDTTGAGRVARLVATGCAVAAALGLECTAVAAQILYATPEIGTSQRRGPALGARVGVELVAGLDAVGQMLVYFPDETSLADPGVEVERGSWQGSANLLYAFDRERAIAPYVGAGLRYGRASLSVTVDGLRAIDRRDGFALNLVGGVRLTRVLARPFVEYRNGGGSGWVVTGGARLRLRR